MMLWSVDASVLTSAKDSADQSCWETVDNDWVSQTLAPDWKPLDLGLERPARHV